MQKIYSVKSNIKPEMLDTTSSKIYVYEREDINEIVDEKGKSTFIYNECIYTREEYNNKKLQDITDRLDEVVNTDELSLQDSIAYKVREIGKDCKSTIENGIDITLTDGTIEHFSLTSEDQSNISTQVGLVLSLGVDKCTYHADGKDCKFYTAKDMIKIYFNANKHILEQTTYCNILNNYIRSMDSKEKVLASYYGMELPSDKQEYIKNIVMDQINTFMNAAVKKFGSSILD